MRELTKEDWQFLAESLQDRRDRLEEIYSEYANDLDENGDPKETDFMMDITSDIEKLDDLIVESKVRADTVDDPMKVSTLLIFRNNGWQPVGTYPEYLCDRMVSDAAEWFRCGYPVMSRLGRADGGRCDIWMMSDKIAPQLLGVGMTASTSKELAESFNWFADKLYDAMGRRAFEDEFGENLSIYVR